MGPRHFLSLLAAASLAAGCDSADAPAPGNASAAAPPPPAISAQRLVGRWSESPDCASGFEFRSDGTFTVGEAGQAGSGRWTLAGDRLTLTGGNGSATVRLRQLDEQAMVAVDPEGRTARSIRCEGRS